MAALRSVVAVRLGDGDGKRPTVLRQQLAELCNAASTAVVAGLRVTEGFTVGEADRVELTSLVMRHILTGRDTLHHHPKSAKKLGVALAGLQAAAVTFTNPDVTPTAPVSRHQIPVTVPGPDGRLARGSIECVIADSGQRVVRWYPDDGPGFGARIEQLLTQPGKQHAPPFRLGEPAEWDRLALTIITVAAGWLTSELPLPPILADGAVIGLGVQLRHQFSTGEWSIQAESVLGWLEHTGYATRGIETSLTDEALTRTRQLRT